MSEDHSSLSPWREPARFLRAHTEAALKLAIAGGISALVIAFRDSLWRLLIDSIVSHPARTGCVLLFGLATFATAAASMYRRRWIDLKVSLSRVPELEELLSIERAKLAKLESTPKPPSDPLPGQGMKRVLTYLVNSYEATAEEISREIGENQGSTDSYLKTLVLDHGFLTRRLSPDRTTYLLTEVAEDYIAKFSIPTINRGTMRRDCAS